MQRADVGAASPRWRVIWAILAKELRETLRDRRTLFLLIAVPMVFYPILMVLITEVTISQKEALEQQAGAVAVEGAALPEGLRAILAEDKLLEVGGEAPPQVTLALPADVEARLARGEAAEVELRYDSTDPLSQEIKGRVGAHLERWRGALVKERLGSRGLSEAFVRPLEVKEADQAPRERQLGALLSQFLPMLVLIFMVTGAFYPAIDLTAGEKERKTIQTLLSSPVRPLEVVLGKYLTVFLIALISGLINILSISLILGQVVWLSKAETSAWDLDVSWVDVGALVWMVLLLGAMFSALMMTVATLADSPKNAQSYLSPIYLLCLAPVMIAQIPGVELSAATAFVPVLNLSLAIKEVLISGAKVETMFLISASTAASTALLLSLAARLYQREELLIERSGARALFGGRQRGGGGVPGIGDAVMLMAVLFVVLYYVGSALQSWDLMGGLVLTLFGGMLAPVLLTIRWQRLDWRRTLHLSRPPAAAMGAAALLGVSSFVWVGALARLFYDTFLPVPEVFERALREAFTAPDDPWGKALLVAVVAISPAICEEAVFRGWLLSSFRGKVRPWVAVLVTSLIFGIFHLSIYRLLGTTALGLIMGWMVWRTGSIWPSVLYHLLNNASSLLSEDALRALGVKGEAEPTPIWLLALSVALSIAGFLLMLRAAPEGEEESG
jgi:sodium transport system permease protein